LGGPTDSPFKNLTDWFLRPFPLSKLQFLLFPAQVTGLLAVESQEPGFSFSFPPPAFFTREFLFYPFPSSVCGMFTRLPSRSLDPKVHASLGPSVWIPLVFWRGQVHPPPSSLDPPPAPQFFSIWCPCPPDFFARDWSGAASLGLFLLVCFRTGVDCFLPSPGRA